MQQLVRPRGDPERPLLLAASDTIASLDSIFARARFARDFDAAMPEFAQNSELSLEAARHPVLEDKLRRENRSIVPMSLNLGGTEKLLVISGPNTGGKTVALKTTGLAALSAQSAIPVTAHHAVLPLFDRVLVDIGDEQSIAADLSTFSAHMLNLKTMFDAATPQSLVLVDEMGTPKRRAITKTLLRRPGLISQLLRMRSNSVAALDNLGRAVAHVLLNQGWPHRA